MANKRDSTAVGRGLKYTDCSHMSEIIREGRTAPSCANTSMTLLTIVTMLTSTLNPKTTVKAGKV